jgi:hypothetical protein
LSYEDAAETALPIWSIRPFYLPTKASNKHCASELNEEEGAQIMPVAKKLHGLSPVAVAHVDELLDEALDETFPASDPVAINIERTSDQPTVTFKRSPSAALADDCDGD